MGNSPPNLIDPLGLCELKKKFWETVTDCGGDAVNKVGDAVGALDGARRNVLPENAEFFVDWVTGRGATERYYYEGSREVRDLRGSAAADVVRDAFVANGCRTVTGVEYDWKSAARDTLLPPNTDPFNTQTQMGGFDEASAIKEGNGMIGITIYNEASLWSFLYHRWPHDWGVGPSKGPFRTIKQTFEWTEPVPGACRG